MYDDYEYAEYVDGEEEYEKSIEQMLEDDEIDSAEEGYMLGAFRAEQGD